jgi:predicted O-methyltransferase YrrM
MKKLTNNFEQTCTRLESLDKTFLIEGVPHEYKDVWAPNNEIKLWQIPRTSAEVLRAFALGNKAQTVLELGTSAGYSAIWLASAVEEFGGKVYTVELAKPKIEMAKQSFAEAGLSNSIEQIEGEAGKVLDNWDKEIDIVFLDADKPNYLSYIQKFEKHLKAGSMIIADNATDFADSMQDYLEYVTTSNRYYSFLLNIDHGLMISIKL